MDSLLEDPWQLLIYYIPLMMFFFLFSAMFSAAETALFSLSKLRVKQMESEEGKTARRISGLLKEPHKLLVSIVVGNLFVNTILSAGAAGVAQSLGGDRAVSASAGIMVMLLLIFGEITPKMVAVSKPERIANILCLPIALFSTIAGPVVNLLQRITDAIISVTGLSPVSAKPSMTEDELKSVLNIGVELGIIESNRGEMLSSALDFCDTRVREIMTPRTDMTFLMGDETIADCFEIIRETGFSRYPVCDANVDSVVGVLYVKDILPYKIKGVMEQHKVRELVRPAYFVPETKTIDQLMKTFQKKKIQMSIVLDEYGGTEGLVTMEDILEEIVGDILDEYDEEETLIQKQHDGTYLVDARINAHDLAEELDFELDEEADYETAGGMLLSIFGRIPSAGEQIEDKNFQYRIIKVEENRILQIQILPLNRDAVDSNDGASSAEDYSDHIGDEE